MLSLYLTGAGMFLGEQKDGYQSLGGFQSSILVPNGRMDFLFGLLSNMTLKNKTPEYIGLILRNDGIIDANNVTLKYIYDSIFKEKVNKCNYLIAATSLINNQRMEKIGSRYDQPFNAEFHDASFSKADLVVKVFSQAAIGEQITIFGETTAPMTSILDTHVVDRILDAFIGNINIEAVRKSSNEIYFKYKSPINISVAPNFSTTGTIIIQTSAPQLANDYDNEVIISNKIEPGNGIGIWIKRMVKENNEPTNQELYDKWKAGLEDDSKKENLEVIISYT